MRLGLIVPGGFDPSGREGTIPALLGLAQELARRHQVRVFAAAGRAGPGRYRIGDVQVTQMGPASGLRLAAGFARWVSESGPFDRLHAFWADRTALLATLYARLRSVPSLISIGGGELVWLPDIGYGGAGTVWSRAISRAALRWADAVTAGSAYAARPLRLRAQIVPLGVDVARFAAAPSRPMGPPWRLLHVANLNRVKDQTTLLAALRRVVDRLGDARLDCVGEDALAGGVQRQAHALGLGERIAFHGFLPQDQLAAFYRQAHLHVLASRHESQGVVVLEAAAAGLPTVGTRVGLLDTLAPAAACAVPVGDAAALADAICALLGDPGAREAMGAAAQRFAQAHDVGWTAGAFEEIYSHLEHQPADPGGVAHPQHR
ncbi:MAG TPA: glycosyltransferase family 4 protein [Polyangia bacterium]|nr:glycosyltransferase family 4 protein [Polyangia bacterium]